VRGLRNHVSPNASGDARTVPHAVSYGDRLGEPLRDAHRHGETLGDPHRHGETVGDADAAAVIEHHRREP
jgi:hypothetical protein